MDKLDSIYEILMDLPLFKGQSYNKIYEVVGRTKLHFLKYQPGETIINAGDPCTHVKFILSGSVRSTVTNSDGRFSVSQTLTGPEVIAPQYLFGRITNYRATVKAIDTVSVLQLEKSEWMNVLAADPIVLINYLNTLSTYAQRTVDGLLAVTHGSLEERLALWIVSLTQRGGKDIVLTCRQRNLYAFFGTQRSSFIATLEGMKQRGMLDYTVHEVRVNSREAMIDLLYDS